jgi:hypothetical protein
MRTISICSILLLFIGCKQNVEKKEAPISEIIQQDTIHVSSDKIHYYHVNKDSPINIDLYAKLNEKIYVLIDSSEAFANGIAIEKIADFNNNGYDDVLVTIIGGNCCGNQYLIFSFDGEKFRRTKEIGYDFNEIEILNKNGNYSFVVESDGEGVGNTTLSHEVNTYELKNYSFRLLKKQTPKWVFSNVQIQSKIFSEDYETQNLLYDLDDDKVKDTIVFTYHSRWGRMDWEINFGNGKYYEAKNTQSKRIGILKTKTNGQYDLVKDIDEVLKWNGEKYQY